MGGWTTSRDVQSVLCHCDTDERTDELRGQPVPFATETFLGNQPQNRKSIIVETKWWKVAEGRTARRLAKKNGRTNDGRTVEGMVTDGWSVNGYGGRLTVDGWEPSD